MHDLLHEDVLTTAGAARHLRERVPDSNYSPVVIWRWMTGGALSKGGKRIYLEHGKLGRKLITSRQALSRFAARLASVESPNIANTDDASEDLRRNGFFREAGHHRAIAEAEKQFDARGITGGA